MADDIDEGAIDDFLEHFGVKGMKWGVRKAASGAARVATAPARQGAKNAQALARGPVGRVASAPARQGIKNAQTVKGAIAGRIEQRRDAKLNPKGSAEYVNSRKILLKNPSQMTNDELRQLTQRMELERKYNQMNPSIVKRGFAITKKVLEVADMSQKVIDLKKHPLVKAAPDAYRRGIELGKPKTS